MLTKLSLRAALAGLLCWVIGFAGATQAQTAPPPPIVSPMVGLGFDQTFQLNVTTFNPCQIAVAIMNADGQVYLRYDFKLVSTTTITWNANQAGLKPQERAELYATVTVAQPSPAGPCQPEATVEIYDNFTHASSVIAPELPAVQAGPPFFGLGPVGVTAFQTVRLNVLAHPPDPCAGVLSFVDANGNPVGGSITVCLEPGRGAFLDLPGALLAPAFFRRAEVVPRLTPLPGAAPGACATSVEVYDQLTGWTRAFVPPGPPI